MTNEFPEYIIKLSKEVVGDNEKFIIEDYDIDRVYLRVDGKEFIIRTWDFEDHGNKLGIRWTYFKITDDENIGSHGEERNYGTFYFDKPIGEA